MTHSDPADSDGSQTRADEPAADVASIDSSPYRVLERKRDGDTLSDTEIQQVVDGAVSGTWDDSQLAAFLMAATIRGLDAHETRALTVAMLESGETWDLAASVSGVVDKHSTGGVGDKVSMILAPLLASCGVPIAKLTGRGLGHTGGTADKLAALPGLRLDIDRARAVKLLDEVAMMVATASLEVAPADKRIYALRDVTATVESLPLIVSSILSKKLALGASSLVFDVKTGNGSFFANEEQATSLAGLLVQTAGSLGRHASAVVTDMSQPLGEWAGNDCELREALSCLEGAGGNRLMEVTYTLCEELLRSVGRPLGRVALERKIESGEARTCFDRWAAAQGTSSEWLRNPTFEQAPEEVVAVSPREGVLASVDTRRLGMLLLASGAGRRRAGDALDRGVSLRYETRLGQPVGTGQLLARLYVRKPSEKLAQALAACFRVAAAGAEPLLIRQRIAP